MCVYIKEKMDFFLMEYRTQRGLYVQGEKKTGRIIGIRDKMEEENLTKADG